MKSNYTTRQLSSPSTCVRTRRRLINNFVYQKHSAAITVKCVKHWFRYLSTHCSFDGYYRSMSTWLLQRHARSTASTILTILWSRREVAEQNHFPQTTKTYNDLEKLPRQKPMECNGNTKPERPKEFQAILNAGDSDVPSSGQRPLQSTNTLYSPDEEDLVGMSIRDYHTSIRRSGLPPVNDETTCLNDQRLQYQSTELTSRHPKL